MQDGEVNKMIFSTLVQALLKSEIRDKTILVRSLPFVGVVLLLFAFAFDPDRGILESIAPGLWWVTTTFAALFIYVRDAHNKIESKYISQFGIEGSTLFLARVCVNAILTGIVAFISGVLTLLFFSPEIANLHLVLVVGVLTTISLATIGAIYSPLVAKLHDSGQLLSLIVIPILLPGLLCAIRATEAALDSSPRQSLGWISLLSLFSVLFLAAGTMASDSLED